MEDLIQQVVFLMVIVALARLANLLSRRWGLSAITVQMLFGILLGPSLLNLSGAPIVLGTWGSPSPGFLHSALKILAEIGLIQLMFLAGLNTDWRRLKSKLQSILSIGTWGFIFTTAGVVVLMRLFEHPWPETLAMSAIMAASSFGISVHNWTQMKVPESHPVTLMLGTAIPSGCLAVLLMTGSLAASYMTIFGAFKMIIAVSWFLGKLIMFLAISYFLTSRFLMRVAKPTFEKRPRQMLVGYLLLVASLYAWAAMHFGGFAAVGVASIGGGLLGVSPLGLKEKIARGLESGPASLPVGVFFVALGFGVNLRGLKVQELFAAALFVTVVGAKLMGGWFATREAFDSTREQILSMLGTLSQGEMGILIAAHLFSRGLLNPSLFHMAIFMVLVLTMLTPVSIKIASRCIPFQTRQMTGIEPGHSGSHVIGCISDFSRRP
jgi:Kef-type K+ transport system membrane component KefB